LSRLPFLSKAQYFDVFRLLLGSIQDISTRKRTRKLVIDSLNPKLLVFEIGAGLNIPTVRSFCEKTKMFYDCGMIRINPRDYLVPSGEETLALGALESLELLDSEISNF